MVVQLIAKNKQEKLQYEGKCKLMIDSISKLLLVEPVNEEYKMISAMFKWKFVAQKNILFVFAEYDFQDFALIFDDPKKCNKIYEILVKKGATPGNKELIHERFLPELFNEICANTESSSKLKEILFKWIEYQDGKEKEEHIKILQNYHIYNSVFSRINNNSNPRKRKANDCFYKNETSEQNGELDAKRPNGNLERIIEKPNFEIVSYERNKICKKRFIIFLDPSRISCYEYAWNSQRKTYYCCECLRKNHFVRANICQKEDGTEFVVLKSGQHICEPRKYNPGKYGEKEIVQAENFKIFKEFQNGKDKSKLVIFASSDKATCYEYYWENQGKKFVCLGCNKNKNNVTAELCVHDDGNNYLKLSKKKHTCEPREFKPEKFDISKKEIVESSNFRILKYKNNCVETSRLIVFCETNKKLCYEYYWNQIGHFYQCPYCPVGKRPTATVCQNNDSKDYLILNNVEHVCNLREFNPEKYSDDIVLDKTMYKFCSTTAKILAIFSTQEKQFYYKFVFNNHKKYYYCSRCCYSKLLITATLQNEGKENEILYVSNQKHICEPFKYSFLVENSIVKLPNYEMIQRKINGKIHQHLVVFTNEEKTECYEYGWHGHSKTFSCRPCSKRYKIHVFAKRFKNEENEECVELCKTKHKCQPIKYVPENITPTKIVKEADFKLYEIFFRGKNMKKLVIFDSKNRNYGYVYTFIEGKKKYVCSRCSAKSKNVTATIKKQENGQNYVELNKIEHVCELKKL